MKLIIREPYFHPLKYFLRTDFKFIGKVESQSQFLLIKKKSKTTRFTNLYAKQLREKTSMNVKKNILRGKK